MDTRFVELEVFLENLGFKIKSLRAKYGNCEFVIPEGKDIPIVWMLDIFRAGLMDYKHDKLGRVYTIKFFPEKVRP